MLVVGSGFAGSLVAWGLVRLGARVLLVERGRHPRTVLGESSTPLANLALERLAFRLESRELYDLAAWGRWRRAHPGLRVGRKRGFSFYSQVRGQPLAVGEGSTNRLVVAASPDDEIADTQWWRADVDASLVDLASAAGVDYRDLTELDRLESIADGYRVRAARRWRRSESSIGVRSETIECDFVIDASGAEGFLARQLELGRGRRVGRFDGALLAGHFADVASLYQGVGEPADAPYDEDHGAVHQILDEGWMYQLRFDDGLVSAGFVVSRSAANRDLIERAQRAPEDAFAELLRRYPSLDDQFLGARRHGPIRSSSGLVFRRQRAAAERSLLLPQAFAFFDPLYSTGIAWSLLAVERILDLFAAGTPGPSQLRRYEALLTAEADQIERLVDATYRSFALDRADASVEVLARTARLYFVAASYQEARQRLLDVCEAPPCAAAGSEPASRESRRDGWAWDGFLGAGDPVVEAAFSNWRRILDEHDPASDPSSLDDELRRLLAPRDVAGLLHDPGRRAVGVELEPLVRRAALIGLDPEVAEQRLPRLRGRVWR